MKKFASLFLTLILLLLTITTSTIFAASDSQKETTKNINFYITADTLPTLYTVLNMYSDNSESYFWCNRGKTVIPENFPEHVELILPLTEEEEYSNPETTKKLIEFTKNVINKNPDAHFNLFTDDLKLQYELTLFRYNGLTPDRYNIYLIGNGIGAYELFKTLYVYSNNPKQQWDSQKSRYLEYVEKAFNGDVTEPFNHDSFKNEAWYATTQDNFEYWLQWPELMVANNDDIKNELKKSNLVKKLPNDMYASLSEENKARFMSTVGINKDEWDNKYFPGLKDGKKYLIISGTSTGDEGGSFERVAKNIIKDYGNEYTYYYKPHPRYPAKNVPGREEFLKNNNITELPAQTPLETIIWAYPEVTVGGYSSSTYMSAVSGQVDFFIANSPVALSTPLPEIYNLGFYNNSKFYRITSKDLNDTIKLSNTYATFNDNNTKNITVNFSEVKEPAFVFLVLYDTNGKIIRTESITIDENNSTALFKNVPIDSLKNNAKILVWDGNNKLKPQLTTIYGSEF